MSDQATWTAMAMILGACAVLFVYWLIQEHFWSKDMARERDAARGAHAQRHIHPAE